MRLPGREKLMVVGLGFTLVWLAFWAERYPHPTVGELITRLDYLIYDTRLGLLLQEQPPPLQQPIAIIDIDEKSLSEQGRWPWSREVMADLVEKLWYSGVVVIGFDMVFAEAERNPARVLISPLRDAGEEDAARTLAAVAGQFDYDQRFAEVLGYGDAVLGYAFHAETDTPPAGELPASTLRVDELAYPPITIPERTNYAGNLPVLQQAATYGGFFTTHPDDDGVIRRSPLVIRHGDGIYGSLALEMARLFFLLDRYEVRQVPIGGIPVVEGIELGDKFIPTDEQGQVIVPYRGPAYSFKYISATDVLNERVPLEKLEGSLVLIGTSAQGLFDLRATPVSNVYPGVEVHANILSGIIEGRFPAEPKWAEGLNLLIILLAGVLLSLLMPFLNPAWLTGVAAVSVGGLVTVNAWLLERHGLILSEATPLLMIILLTITNLAYGFLFENRRREGLAKRFGEYVPPQLVEEMSRNPEDYGFDGENREMSVLFADIRSFTTISESLSASDLKNLLNRFFTPMTKIIFDNRGTIDKYVGDMIMAFWGAPVDDPEHRRHAVRAALNMLAEVKSLRQTFINEGLPAVDIGVGINSGDMNVGDMGSSYRRAYTVLGDAVNLASRLEGLTKYYGVHFVVSEFTKGGLEDEFLFRKLDLVKVKGKKEAVTVFEPVCALTEASTAQREAVSRLEAAISAYLVQDWHSARDTFTKLAADWPDDRLYQLYLERIDQLEANPPGAGWDGSYTRTEK